MKKNHDVFALRPPVLAVRGALMAMAMLAAPQIYAAGLDTSDPEVAELVQAKSSVEVGITNTSSGSYKFGEYNGLEKKGVTANGAIDLRSGGSFDSEDATRLRVIGNNLGLENRDLSVEYGEQGKFRINAGYDELLRNRSDSYRTPYQGIGSNNLPLPANWIPAQQLNINPNSTKAIAPAGNARTLDPNFNSVDTVYRFNNASNSANATQAGGVSAPYAPTAAQQQALNAIAATDDPAFRNVNLYTKRTKYDGGFSYIFDTEWDIKASARHEVKNGYKPMGTVSRNTGGDMSAILADPINQTTDQVDLSVNFKNDKSFFTAAYYGSFFKNNVSSLSWQNWAATGLTTNTMSSAPSNQFNQLSLTGGYDLSKKTKLVAYGSYARNTQNDSFLTDATTPVVPTSSLNGLVVSKAFNLKLTDRSFKDLSLTGAYKYDNRDNRTAVNTYQYADAGEAAVASTLFKGVVAQNANANRPYSKKVNQLNLDADYAIAKGQAIKAGYDWQKIDRYCDGSWISCADAGSTRENTLRAEWRTSVIEDVSTKVGYAYSARKVDYNENAFLALVPYANVTPTGATTSAYQYMLSQGLNGWGPNAGFGATTGNANIFFPSNNALANAAYANNNRISELPGMRRYNMADRNRDKLRATVNWQTNEKFSLQGGLDYNKDNYQNSVYGLQNAKSWALNLEGTYAASEDFSTSLFYTYEDQRSNSAGNNYAANSNAANVNGATQLAGGCSATVAARNLVNKIDPCENWSYDMRDKVDTLGVSFRQKNLMKGKLDLGGDLTFTRARTDNNPTGGIYANNPAAVAGATGVTTAAYYIAATALPTVTTDITQLRLTGRYAIDKATAVRLGYTFARMKSSDYAYDGMQIGGIAGVLPTSEQSPAYTVHVISAAYFYSF